MRIRLTLHPHQDGAKHLRAQYGDRLVCVRYRYDEQRKKRFKTMELIVDEEDWEPALCVKGKDRVVAIRVGLPERETRQRVKAAGGKWQPRLRVWELSYTRVMALGLADRIVKNGEG